MHKGPITSVVVSKDGKRVYTAGYDKMIFAWDRESGTSQLLGTHTHLVNALALSEDGTMLASSSSDYTVNLYDLNSLTFIRTLYGHADDVEALSFADEDRLLVTTSRDRRALVFDVQTGAILREFRGHSKDVLSLWVNEGLAFTTGDDGRALIWDIATAEMKGEIGPFDCELDAVSGNGKIGAFAIGADDGRVMIYDANSLSLRQAIQAHERGVKRVVFSPSGQYLMTAGYDHRIKIWDTTTGTLKQELPAYKYQWERALAFSPDEACVVGASFGNRYCEWSLATGELISPQLELATPSINDVAISAEGLLATASDDGRFRVNGEQLGMAEGTLTNGVGISDDSRYVLWGDHAAEVHLLDRTGGSEMTRIVLGTGPINSIHFCSEDGLFYVGTYGGWIHIVDPQKAEDIQRWQAHDGAVKALQADDKYVASCSADGSIHLFDKQNVTELALAFHGPTAIVNDLFLDSARNRVVAVSRDKVVRLFDIATGKVIGQHDVHRYSIKSVTVTENGTVVSGDYWGHVVIWKPEADELTDALRIADNGISALRSLGNDVYACSYEGGVYKLTTEGEKEEVLRLFDQAAPVLQTA